MKPEKNGSLSALALDVSGWIAAAVFAVYAIAGGAPRAAEGERSGDGGREAVRTAAAEPAAKSAAPEQEESRAEPSVAYDPVPGNDWEPPGKIDSFDGIDAMCARLSPADRALVDRMRAAYESRSAADAVALAREARRSRDPKVRLLALRMLEACVEAESASGSGEALGGLMDATMCFWQDANASVKKAALASGFKTMASLPTDTAVGMLERIVDAARLGGDRAILSRGAVSAVDALLGRMVAGDAVKWVDEAVRLRKTCGGPDDDSYYFLARVIEKASGVNVAGGMLGGFLAGRAMDDKGVAEWKERRAELEALGAEKSADPLFPPKWAAVYEKKTVEAGKRFKDVESEEAQKWIADEMEVAAADISSALAAEREGKKPDDDSTPTLDGRVRMSKDFLKKAIQTGEHSYMILGGDF